MPLRACLRVPSCDDTSSLCLTCRFVNVLLRNDLVHVLLYDFFHDLRHTHAKRNRRPKTTTVRLPAHPPPSLPSSRQNCDGAQTPPPSKLTVAHATEGERQLLARCRTAAPRAAVETTHFRAPTCGQKKANTCEQQKKMHHSGDTVESNNSLNMTIGPCYF